MVVLPGGEKVEDMYNRLDRIPARDRQTDRRTSCYGKVDPRYAYTTRGKSRPVLEQELSYRKQIARKLRTQYVESTHRPKYYTVTLKSTLRVTQGHWKRNHLTHHTRLTISQVI